MLGAGGACPGAQEGLRALWAGQGLPGEATLGKPLGGPMDAAGDPGVGITSRTGERVEMGGAAR